MKDKNGIEIKEGDLIKSKGIWIYRVFRNPHFNNELFARGQNCKHTSSLKAFNQSDIEIIQG